MYLNTDTYLLSANGARVQVLRNTPITLHRVYGNNFGYVTTHDAKGIVNLNQVSVVRSDKTDKE